MKSLKIEKFCFFLMFSVSVLGISFNIFTKVYWTAYVVLVERFQFTNSLSLSKFDKNCLKTFKIGHFWSFCGHFGSFWGHFSHSQNSPKFSTNTYRTKLNIRELSFAGDTYDNMTILIYDNSFLEQFDCK